jgi:hypothetical protein
MHLKNIVPHLSSSPGGYLCLRSRHPLKGEGEEALAFSQVNFGRVYWKKYNIDIP